jgi:hypothetical protein
MADKKAKPRVVPSLLDVQVAYDAMDKAYKAMDTAKEVAANLEIKPVRKVVYVGGRYVGSTANKIGVVSYTLDQLLEQMAGTSCSTAYGALHAALLKLGETDVDRRNYVITALQAYCPENLKNQPPEYLRTADIPHDLNLVCYDQQEYYNDTTRIKLRGEDYF